jgi:hypothetical protein
VRIAKVIRRRIREQVAGIDVASDVNAAVAANVGGRDQVTSVSSTQRGTASVSGAPGPERPERPDESSPPGSTL